MKPFSISVKLCLTLLFFLGPGYCCDMKDPYGYIVKKMDPAMKKVKDLKSKVNVSAGTKRWNFGVLECWNTSLTDIERLMDVCTRLKTLTKTAIQLSSHNPSAKIFGDLTNAYDSIQKCFNITCLQGPKLKRSDQEKKQMWPQFLDTLQKTLILAKADFDQKPSVTV